MLLYVYSGLLRSSRVLKCPASWCAGAIGTSAADRVKMRATDKIVLRGMIKRSQLYSWKEKPHQTNAILVKGSGPRFHIIFQVVPQ